jgi:hypothetical protein
MIIKGYPSQEKRDDSTQKVVTVQPVNNGGYALETVSNAQAAVVASDTVEAGSTSQVINATAHSAEAGDLIRFTTGGALYPREIPVESVDTNTITLAKPAPSAPGTGDPFDVMRFFHETVSLSGTPFSQQAFIRDAANQIVTEDTGTPANNRPLPTKLFNDSGTAADFGSGVVGSGTIRNTPATDSEHLLNTRHEAVGTPLSSRLGDGTDFISSEAIAASQKTVSTLTKTIASLSIGLGFDGTDHREVLLDSGGRTLLSTRHETVTTPLATRLGDGTDFIDAEALAASQKTIATLTKAITSFGIMMGWDGATHRELLVDTAGSAILAARHEAVATPLSNRLSDGTDFISSEALAASQKTVSTLTKTLGTVAISLGWDGTAHREIAVNTSGETTLDTRHEAVATPLSSRLSDGTNFIGSEAIAAAQKTLSSETAVLSTLSVGLGWDGATHREIGVNTSGHVQTTTQTVAASFPAKGEVAGTALTGTYANVFTAASDLSLLMIFNSCNQPIVISLDAGVTDHFELGNGQSMTIDAGMNSRHIASGTDIRAKHDGVVPTSGTLNISAMV